MCIHLRIKNGGASKAPARAGCCIYFFSIAGWRRNSARRETRRALKPPPSRSVGECPALYRMRGWPLTYAHRGCFDMRRDSVFRLQQSVATRMMGRSHPPGDAHVAADVRHGAAQGIVPLTWLGVLMIWHERPETVRGLRRPVKDKKQRAGGHAAAGTTMNRFQKAAATSPEPCLQKMCKATCT